MMHNLQRLGAYFILLIVGLSSIAFKVEAATGFFTPPEAPYLTHHDESVVRIHLPGGAVRNAQQSIDRARKLNPTAHLILEAQSVIKITQNPLLLGSRMSLRFTPSGGLSASNDATTHSLIEITGEQISVSSVGIGPALITGSGLPIVGIKITAGARIHIDHLRVENCAGAAILLRGRNSDQVNESCSVTRCSFDQNGVGLHVDQSAGFMCLDNRFTRSRDSALRINSRCSIVAGNHFQNNGRAIESGSDRGVITRNTINDTVTLELTAASSGILVSENRSTSTDLKILIDGKNNQLFKNDWAGSVVLGPTCKKAFLIANPRLVPLTVTPNLSFFNPPTLNNPHQDSIIIPGLARFDLTVPGGKVTVTETNDPVTGKKKSTKTKAIPVDVAQVQKAVDEAHTANPNAVIVLNLDGEYVSRDPNGLRLPANTCVILKGRILADLSIPTEPQYRKEAPNTQVVLMGSSGFSSFSGGILDAARQAFHPMNATTESINLIDGVTLTAGARDGLYTKGRAAESPVFIYGCNVTGNHGRGIWSHVATRVHSIANVVSNNSMDGIDLDAHSDDGTALFNVCSGNQRHGIFIEEAIRHHVVFGNQLAGNRQSGIHIWNEEVEGNTGSNVVAANVCFDNFRGIALGARAADRTAHGNLLFNNICRQNLDIGLRTGNAHACENYISQTVVWGNQAEDLQNPDSAKAYLFNTDLPDEEGR
ncbi:MAG: hypothetical protein RLZZ245_3321 [Verrucomicrobiota bacterium]